MAQLRAEGLFKEIMAEDFPNLKRNFGIPKFMKFIGQSNLLQDIYNKTIFFKSKTKRES